MPDALFADPRLAPLYDAFDDDRSDLAAYLGLVAELGADRVLDVGCGTGTLALLLAGQGRTVTGLDPAEASLAVARAKPGARAVTPPLVSFRHHYTFPDGRRLRSHSTLRFRRRDERERSLAAHGFATLEIRQAPDRPGLEDVFVALRVP